MSAIKSHDRKKFGISCDFGYFTEDNVIEVAHNALLKGEFLSAREAYEFVLEKYPDDFDALKGLILCDSEWKSIHPILHMSKVTIKEYTPSLTHALDNCRPEHKVYFTKIAELLRIKKEYKKEKSELKELEAQRASEQKILKSLLDRRKANRSKLSDVIRRIRAHKSSVGLSYLDISLAVFLLCTVVGTMILGRYVLIAAALVPLSAYVIYTVRKEIRDNLIETEIKPHADKISRLEEDYDSKIKEAQSVKEEYIRKAKSLIALDVEFSGSK
ncbi:hypothetical protein SAMN06296952_0409 [Oscillospiraceae bacterium]|nr:hypothetical protein SAMN06296952_0409 [Oscillospiraceae bacterium]